MTLNGFYGERTRGAVFIECKRFNCFMLFTFTLAHHTLKYACNILMRHMMRTDTLTHTHTKRPSLQSHIVCFKDTVSAEPTFYCGLLNHLRTAKTNHIIRPCNGENNTSPNAMPYYALTQMTKNVYGQRKRDTKAQRV